MPKRRPASVELDAVDLGILTILQRDNRTPQREIGEAVHLSAPAVQRRIKRLEEAGVISANVCVVDPDAAGSWLTILVNVDLESERMELVDRAKVAFRSERAVQQCYYVAGETDFVLVVGVRSMAEYEALTRRLFFGNDNVKRFRTFVAMDRVKVGMALPLDG